MPGRRSLVTSSPAPSRAGAAPSRGGPAVFRARAQNPATTRARRRPRSSFENDTVAATIWKPGCCDHRWNPGNAAGPFVFGAGQIRAERPMALHSAFSEAVVMLLWIPTPQTTSPWISASTYAAALDSPSPPMECSM